MVLAFDGTSHSVVEGHCDKPSAGVHIIQDEGKGDGSGFPLTGFRAEVALDLLKDLHTFSKHIVAVDLAERRACERQAIPAGLHRKTVQLAQETSRPAYFSAYYP